MPRSIEQWQGRTGFTVYYGAFTALISGIRNTSALVIVACLHATVPVRRRARRPVPRRYRRRRQDSADAAGRPRRRVENLRQRPAADAPARSRRRGRHILPCLHRGAHSQLRRLQCQDCAAAPGLEFNRGFPYIWAPEGDEQGAGPYPLSEPETRAIAHFITEHPISPAQSPITPSAA
jgi:hypothetical protein